MKGSWKLDLAAVLLLLIAIATFIAVAKIAPYNMWIAMGLSIVAVLVCVGILSAAISKYADVSVVERETKRRGGYIKSIPCYCDTGSIQTDGMVLLYGKGFCFIDDVEYEDGDIELVTFTFFDKIEWIAIYKNAIWLKIYNRETDIIFESDNILKMKALFEFMRDKGVPSEEVKKKVAMQ